MCRRSSMTVKISSEREKAEDYHSVKENYHSVKEDYHSVKELSSREEFGFGHASTPNASSTSFFSHPPDSRQLLQVFMYNTCICVALPHFPHPALPYDVSRCKIAILLHICTAIPMSLADDATPCQNTSAFSRFSAFLLPPSRARTCRYSTPTARPEVRRCLAR